MQNESSGNTGKTSSTMQSQDMSLIDIGRVLAKHRGLFIKTAGAVFVIGLLIALIMPKAYDLNTSLEISAIPTEEGIRLVEEPQTVKAKLENTFVPMVINDYREEKGVDDRFRIKVRIPKKSSVVLLKSRTTLDKADTYKELHKRVVAAIHENHAKLVSSWKRRIQTELAKARIQLEEKRDPTTLEALLKPKERSLRGAEADLSALKNPDVFGAEIKAAENRVQMQQDALASLKDAATALQKQLQQVDVHADLIKKQIEEIQAQEQASDAMQKNLSADPGNEAVTTTMLLAERDKQENQKLLAELREQLFITLENDKTELLNQLENNKRKQALQLNKIQVAEAELKKIKEMNRLAQQKLEANIAEIRAAIAKLKNDQQRAADAQEQRVHEFQSQLENFVETGAVIAPTISSEPTSVPRWAMLLVAIFLAVILGMVAVFIAELREKME